MPLTKSGVEVLKSMKSTYKDPKKAKSVFYASVNAGKPGSEKWEGNPGPNAPAGEHVAAIHAHMGNITNAVNKIADHVEKLKAIRSQKKQPIPSLGAIANPAVRIKI